MADNSSARVKVPQAYQDLSEPEPISRQALLEALIWVEQEIDFERQSNHGHVPFSEEFIRVKGILDELDKVETYQGQWSLGLTFFYNAVDAVELLMEKARYIAREELINLWQELVRMYEHIFANVRRSKMRRHFHARMG